MSARAAASVEDPLIGTRPECLQRVLSVQRHDRVGCRVVRLGPAVVPFANSRSGYSLRHLATATNTA
jgi:hypothetical protein